MTTIIVTAADISLFHVAARELGEAVQWWRIAYINGLTDPDLGWIETFLSLRLPQAASGEDSGLPDDAS